MMRMQIIRTITEKDFGRESDPSLWSTFSERIGVRAIVVNEQGHILLMHVSNKGYYKLPGGGVDAGESFDEALKRELNEEAGVEAFEVIGEIGEIDEYRERWSKLSRHHCYLVTLTKPPGVSSQTDQEIEHGYKVVWAKNLEDAIDKVEAGTPQEYGPDFERLRELTFLTYAKRSGGINQSSEKTNV